VLERGEHVRPDRFGAGVVDDDVRLDRGERGGDRRELGLAPRDRRDEVEIRRLLDGVRDRPARPAVRARDADADQLPPFEDDGV